MIRLPIGHSGQTLVFHDDVVEHLLRHRQLSWWDKEAGGQLFARFEGPDIVVVEATGPRPTDRRKRRSFVPDRKKEQAEIHACFERGLHFVGDWHSHPEAYPVPSHIDRASVMESVSRSVHDLNGFVLVIVGTAPLPEGLYVGIASQQELFRLPALAEASAPHEMPTARFRNAS